MQELLGYTFFQYALAASVLTGILCAFVGTYVVTRRMSLISGGIAHSSLGGVGLAAWLGFSPTIGAIVFAIVSGYIIRWLSRRKGVREDSAIAMVWTLGMSIGVITAYLAPSFLPELPTFLFGNILTITSSDIITLLILAIVTVIFFVVFLPQIITVAFDYEFALSQRIHAKFIDTIMIILVALTVVACIKVVGIVMAIALLSIPQMTANILFHTFRKIVVLSIIVGIFDCVIGLVAAYYFNVPCGATIIVVSVVIYVLVKAIKNIILTLK